MSLITKLNTVSVYVTDQERALTFYRDALGFAVTMDAGDENFRWLAVAPQQTSETSLVLIKVDPASPHSHPEWVARLGKHTGCVFYTDDIQQAYEQFTAKGVTFTVQPQQLEWGGIEGTFADPDGNQFELVQRPAFLFE